MKNDFLIVNYSETDERGEPKLMTLSPANALRFLEDAMNKGLHIAIYEIGACVVDIS